MTEIAPRFGVIEPQYTGREYAHNSLNIHWRWLLNEYAEEPLDFYDEAFRGIGKNIYENPNKVIADVGSADATTGLAASIRTRDVQASVIGVEPSLEMLSTVGIFKHPSLLKFVGAEAEQLPFVDNSFQGLMSLFTLYHTSDPLASVREIKRVVEPGGIVAISTNDPKNKPQHRMLERIVASKLSLPGILAPAYSFNTEAADEILSAEFEIVGVKRQDCNMVIKGEEGILDYMNSLYSMSDYYQDPNVPAQWRQVVNTEVRDYLERAVEYKGVFLDRFVRSLYICRVRK